MPELPEVETVVRDLRPLLIGRTIVAVRRSRKSLRRPWLRPFTRAVEGAQILGIRRRGKWIIIDLAGRGVIVVHLGMTGQFTVVNGSEPAADHLHVVFELEDGRELRYRDPRRFGSVEYRPDGADQARAMDRAMGPEPFDLDSDSFRGGLQRSARSLKSILLDQRFVAGVGNIYADESAFRARLHPARPGASLSSRECERLREAIEAVLARAIVHRGSSIRDYIGGLGQRGGFQHEFAVYGRTGQPCTVCGTAVQCIRLAGRASHFCPKCQPVSSRRELTMKPITGKP